MDVESLSARFREALPAGIGWCSLRHVDERTETWSVRRDVVQPPSMMHDRGLMITVHEGGGAGYAATPDASVSGIRSAIEVARRWAHLADGRMAWRPEAVQMPVGRGRWQTPVQGAWREVRIADRVERLVGVSRRLPIDPRVVDWSTTLMAVDTDTVFLTADGAEVVQQLRHITPEIEVIAHAGGQTQRRTLGGGRGASRQGGVEVFDHFGFDAEGDRVARQALELLEAPDCPSTATDLVLAPDQMMLQIHESIGHPLELDRILGDERNYAGTSFVTADMFGSYRYGSSLLNVSFAPDVPGEYASYAFDDDGAPAQRELLIADGVLLRPLGGSISQARAGMSGVSNSRAMSWNRPPIDRMANLNVEPGALTLPGLLGMVERGVWMETNASWSIDDSRNKFQFGCEYAREIVDGQLGRPLRNPNYRGISATFWRSLAGVGGPETVGTYGTPYCGKGEPNQVVRVGHASPPCLFRGVDVFGGQA
jgi:predicted Zn-dependent protease